MKAWMVADGDYSDYRVLAVFTDKEQAEEARKRLGADRLEDTTLDELPTKDPRGYVWCIDFDRDGNVESCATAAPDVYGDWAKERTGYWSDASYGGDTIFVERVWAFGETEADAVKSAADTRRMAMALLDPTDGGIFEVSPRGRTLTSRASIV